MRYLRKFNEKWLDFSILSIHILCKKYGIKNYSINDDGSIDVDGDVDLISLELDKIPIKFGEVKGNFDCSRNNLTTLKGSPYSVEGNFICYDNRLTNLEGSPKKVVGQFNCQDNQLTTLEGISKYILGFINCDNNILRDVRGIKEGWRGVVFIKKNPVFEIFKIFPNDRKDEVIEYLNEYDVIRDGKYVVLQALEEVFYEMDLDCPEIEYIEGYEII